MTCSVLVVGMPSPAGCDSTKTWKAAAAFVEHRLAERFGPAVAFEFAELFGPDMAHHPDVEAQIAAGEAVPPIVVIDGIRRFAGGKLNISAIERAVAETLQTVALDACRDARPAGTQHRARRRARVLPGRDVRADLETPLLELAFNRLRDLILGRTAAYAAHSAVDPPVDPFVITAPAVTASPVRPLKDAPYD